MSEQIDPQELEEQQGAELPDREVMSVIGDPSEGLLDLELGNDPPPPPQPAEL